MPGTLLEHAEYITWASKAVRQANDAWRRRIPYLGETLMSRDGLHQHLLTWAVEQGHIRTQNLRPGPATALLAPVFARNPEAVKDAARRYWRELVLEAEESTAS